MILRPIKLVGVRALVFHTLTNFQRNTKNFFNFKKVIFSFLSVKEALTEVLSLAGTGQSNYFAKLKINLILPSEVGK